MVVDELDRKARLFPNPTRATIGRRVFARDAIPKAEARRLGVRWIGVGEIYEG